MIDLEQNTKLKEYVELLLNWNKRMNLIGKSTEPDIWNRHILDSAQLMNLLEKNDINYSSCVDIGTGAGLPGIVLSILGVKNMVLIEKSPLKCNFLKEAKKISENNVEIINDAIENVGNRRFDIVFSRALADLSKLLGYSVKLLKPGGKCIFLKGKKLEEELFVAKKLYDFEYVMKKSLTSEEGTIILIKNIQIK